ncbi:uncharacterized protein BX663DRAFT_489679 [Cokeromyces recurvatus]|uniref:uncharacterized protein n=1 Tax=Cokeromyces recurvatus TaxID=90255 RepID=UPI00221F2976|nr:uncharacterized protein BX663DRAFT_489679 [Cokeromyces recurvatus]KAI7898909.1 hypothetical protein BX663DRAFT_489679 [Cokeromyces recurvatus]
MIGNMIKLKDLLICIKNVYGMDIRLSKNNDFDIVDFSTHTHVSNLKKLSLLEEIKKYRTKYLLKDTVMKKIKAKFDKIGFISKYSKENYKLNFCAFIIEELLGYSIEFIRCCTSSILFQLFSFPITKEQVNENIINILSDAKDYMVDLKIQMLKSERNKNVHKILRVLIPIDTVIITEQKNDWCFCVVQPFSSTIADFCIDSNVVVVVDDDDDNDESRGLY